MDTRKGSQLAGPFHAVMQFKIPLIALSAIFVFLAFNPLKTIHYFPIKTVRIYGINHLNNDEIQQTISSLVERNFFNVNLERIRHELIQLPWVADLNVRRVWPDALEITVYEKNAVARWNSDQLISDAGEIFSPAEATYPEDIPTFNGPYGSEGEMIKYFEAINRLLAPLHAKISNLELSPYSSWKLTLDNGITLQVGHDNILSRVDQFVKVYPKIVRNHVGTDVDYIDLRYPNGMAVRWKKSIKA